MLKIMIFIIIIKPQAFCTIYSAIILGDFVCIVFA